MPITQNGFYNFTLHHSIVESIVAQRTLDRFAPIMDQFNNDIDLVDMNENEKENRSVDSDNAELAPKHFTRMSRKPIAVHSSSEGEEQNSFAEKAPAMPSKRHAKKFTKGSDKNEQDLRSAAVEKMRAELQAKANALRKLQRDLKTEQAEIARLKKLNIKLSDDIKKSKHVIANKDKAIKTLEAEVGGNLKKGRCLHDALDEVDRLERKTKVLTEEFEERLKERKKAFNDLSASSKKFATEKNKELEKLQKLHDKLDLKLKTLTDQSLTKGQSKVDEMTASKLVLLDAERAANVEKMQLLARNRQDAAELKERQTTKKRGHLMSLGNEVCRAPFNQNM